MTSNDQNNLRNNLLELLFNPLARLPEDDPTKEITPRINAATALWIQRQRNALAISILNHKLAIDPTNITEVIQNEAYQKGKLDAYSELISASELTE